MNPVVEINQPVNVIALFKQTSQTTHAEPVRMQWSGRDIAITKLGLCHPTQRGQRLHYIFDVSDGVNDYSLDLDTSTLRWTLLSMIDGSAL